MTARKISSNVLLWGVILTAQGVAAAQAQIASPFATARELYESAEYERALAAMDRMDADAITLEQGHEKAIYTALCLLALNRKVEAETRIQTLVRAEPLFDAPSDTPPRLRTIIDAVRLRLKPSLAQEHYQTGKEKFDNKEFEAALKEFTLVVDLTQDANDTATPAMRDVRVLAAGFLDLTRRAIASSQPSSPPATTVPETTVADIEPPVAIRQNLPQIPLTLGNQMRLSQQRSLSGVLDLVIDAHGYVKSVTVVQRVDPAYDALLLSAAREWTYRPAMKNGEPLEYRKRITIKLAVPR